MKTKNHNNKYLSFLNEQLSKFVVVFLVFSVFSSVSNIKQTYAYFSDEAKIEGTEFKAGTLEIEVDYTDNFNSDLNPGETTSVTASISNVGSLDSQYIVETIVMGDDTSACDYITMEAVKPSISYKGLIKDFVYVPDNEDVIVSPVNIEPTIDSSIDYNFTLDSNAPTEISEKTCTFKWRYTAWQTNFNNSSLGFTSVKEKIQEIHVGEILPIVNHSDVVLNEILADPKSSDSFPANREFIELKNNGNIEINILGWKISEMQGSNEKFYTVVNTTGISNSAFNAIDIANTTISAGNWIVLYLSDSTALNNGNNGNGNGNGDTVSLYDVNGTLIDSYSYTKSTKGKSDARISDGVGGWVDSIPTPGNKNVLEDEINVQDESLLNLFSDTEDQELKKVFEELNNQELIIEKLEIDPINIPKKETGEENSAEELEAEALIIKESTEEVVFEPVVVPERVVPIEEVVEVTS